MFRQFVFVSGLVLLGFGLMSSRLFDSKGHTNKVWDADTPVAEVLKAFGEPYPDHRPDKLDPEKVKQGFELATKGATMGPDGKMTRIQSRYFVCTNCHNMEKEDPDLRSSDPEKRLDYVNEMGLAFLQGTTMYGTVNKVSWYNGDYYKKYGDLVKPANKSLKEAIHLCSVVCSQGRELKDWEMDAMMQYFWSLELKMGDLSLTTKDWELIRGAQKSGDRDADAIKYIKSFYQSGSPATFVEGPESKHEGYKIGREPSAERGKQIYDFACLRCHDQQGPSKYLKLNHDKLSMQLFRKNMFRKGHLSLYDIIRHGTYADKGHRAYMPHYTEERMNNQQVEDLRAYIEQGPY
ncbi:MAG: cytochrome c [Bacteroidota bacterium]